MCPLPPEDLFRIGPTGLEEISDATLNLRLDALERESLRRGYEAATAEEMLQLPEAVQ